MAYEASHQNMDHTPENIDEATASPTRQTQPNTDAMQLSNSTKKAIGAVRASGGNVSDNDLILAAKIDKGEITTEQAIKILIAEYVK